MPAPLFARACLDHEEETKLRKLSTARRAPADLIVRAAIVACSQTGMTAPVIAVELGCHVRTVRRWIGRFNAQGVAGLDDRKGRGRKPRITEHQRSQIIALVATTPPGRLTYDRAYDRLQQADPNSTASFWTLDALTTAARKLGIRIGRSQVRRILLAEGIRWRRVRSWAVSRDPQFVPKGQRSSSCTPTRPRTPQSSAPTSSVR